MFGGRSSIHRHGSVRWKHRLRMRLASVHVHRLVVVAFRKDSTRRLRRRHQGHCTEVTLLSFLSGRGFETKHSIFSPMDLGPPHPTTPWEHLHSPFKFAIVDLLEIGVRTGLHYSEEVHRFGHGEEVH
jgi:hypothetical protein